MTELKLLVLLAAHLVLLALPGVAATLVVARRGSRNVPMLLAVGLAAGGIVAMLTFWAYFADPLLGKALSFVVLLGSLGVLAHCLWRGRWAPGLLAQLATPLGLWLLGSMFLTFLGFLHGGADSPIAMSSTRFSGQLPSDNDIPHFFAEWFYVHGHHGAVPVYPPDWLSSDRPPLQVGYVLTQRAFGWDPNVGLNYQLLCIGLQQLWIVGLWALLLAARVGAFTRALTMLAVLISDVAILNGFFVWPKMLPAAMVLAAAALLLTPAWKDARHDWRSAILVSTLLGLAMLGHGSSVFAIIPLLMVAAFRGLPSWRWLGIALTVGVVLLAPWSAYQKYSDPPGNRLTKWMLAGRTEFNGQFVESEGKGPTFEKIGEVAPAGKEESALESILSAYREAGFGGVLHNKGQNFVEMVGGGPALATLEEGIDRAGEGHFGFAIREVRAILFYNLLPSLGLLLLAPLIMLLARKNRLRNPVEWHFSLVCYAVFIVGAITWGLLLFGTFPARTFIQSGSYVIPVLGICAGVAGLRSVLPNFATWFVGTGALLMFLLYVPSLTPPPGTAYSPLAAILMVAGLVGFLALAMRDVRPAWSLPGRLA